MRKRTQARELALQTVYRIELSNESFSPEIQSEIESQTQDSTVNEFIFDLIKGYFTHLTELDNAIKKIALNWGINRMGAIDRIILRLGAYELLFRSDIPPAVTINEAIDLAKKYGDKESGAFVNGILDKIRH